MMGEGFFDLFKARDHDINNEVNFFLGIGVLLCLDGAKDVSFGFLDEDILSEVLLDTEDNSLDEHGYCGAKEVSFLWVWILSEWGVAGDLEFLDFQLWVSSEGQSNHDLGGLGVIILVDEGMEWWEGLS